MKNSEIGTFLAGIGSTADIDSSGEVVEIEGIEISSLTKDGRIKWEHLGDNPLQIIGKIVDAKKIFKESDCEHELHKKYWEKARKRPFLYVAGVLFDKMGHRGASDAVAHLKFDQVIDHEKTKNMSNWSIEGSRLGKEGNRIKKCIARDFAFTNRECNKACYAELLTDEQADKHVPSIAKKKVEDSMKKSLEEVTDLKKSDRKYYKELADAKKVKIGQPSSSKQYDKITTATGEHREGTSIEPKRTLTPDDTSKKIGVGDRIAGYKKKPKTGAALYRDPENWKSEKKIDLENPLRKAIMQDKKLEKAKVDEGKTPKQKDEIREKRRDDLESTRQNTFTPHMLAEPNKADKTPNKRGYYSGVDDKRRKSVVTSPMLPREGKIKAHKEKLKDIKRVKPNLPKSEKNEILKSLANEAWEVFKHKDLLIETIKKKEPELSENEVMGIAKTYAYIDMKKKESEIEDMFEKDEDLKKGKLAERHRELIASGKKSKWEQRFKEKRTPEKGVHNKAKGLGPKHGGTSEAGAYVKGNKGKARDYDFNLEPRKVQIGEARKEHQKVISEQKQMPKPNLPKSEEMDKKEKPFHNYNPSKHSKEGGLNDKERERINREEGSNLKRPVTGKVKAGSKAASRKKSFCARMSGVKGKTSKDGKLTPKGAALKRWGCAKNEEE